MVAWQPVGSNDATGWLLGSKRKVVEPSLLTFSSWTLPSYQRKSTSWSKVTVSDVGDWVSTAPFAGLVVMIDSAAFEASAGDAFGVVTVGVATMPEEGTLPDELEKSGIALETTPETTARSCRDSSGSRQKWRPVMNRFCRQVRLMKAPENQVEMDRRNTGCPY